jgi:hypothetical protein
MTPRDCLECGVPDVLPNSGYCRHCLKGQVIITVGSKFLIAFGVGAT